MPVAVRLTLNQRQINAMLRSPNGIVARNMRRRGRKVQRHAQRNVHSRTGRLAHSIEVEQTYFAGAPGVQVGSRLFYAIYVHEGTGIYGRSGRPITARAGGYLRFTGRDGMIVFTKQVRGQRPNPFLRDALRSAL